MIVLRDMRESDIEDYVRWFTVETGWMKTDAPWEPCGGTQEEELKSWTEYYNSVRLLPDGAMRWKFEIEEDGRHIGWVSSYTDLDYFANPEEIPAIGISIAEPDCRGRGVGTEALRLFIRYMREKGYPAVYTQTWSGNTAMMRVAEKLGFKVVCRLKDHRTVEGKLYDALTMKIEI